MHLTCKHDHSAGQLPRNIFRKTPNAFRYDKIALEAAVECLVSRPALDLKLRTVERLPTEPRSEPAVAPRRPKDVHYNAFPAQASHDVCTQIDQSAQ